MPNVRSHGTLAMIMVNHGTLGKIMANHDTWNACHDHGKIMARSWQDNHGLSKIRLNHFQLLSVS